MNHLYSLNIFQRRCSGWIVSMWFNWSTGYRSKWNPSSNQTDQWKQFGSFQVGYRVLSKLYFCICFLCWFSKTVIFWEVVLIHRLLVVRMPRHHSISYGRTINNNGMMNSLMDKMVRRFVIMNARNVLPFKLRLTELFLTIIDDHNLDIYDSLFSHFLPIF